MNEQTMNPEAETSTAIIERRDIETITAEIQFYKQQTGEGILEIGKRLNEAKEQLEHGAWEDWLSTRVEFSEAVARRFMRLAREYPNQSLVTGLGSTKALILLALPPEERDEFVEETHEVDGKEKTVADMSKRELEKAVKERAEALDRAAKAEAVAKVAQEAEERGKVAIKTAEQSAAEANKEVERLKSEMEQLRNTEPDLPEEDGQLTIEAIRAEAAAEAKKDAENKLGEEIKAAAEALESAKTELDRAKAQAELEITEATEKIEKLEKQLKVASSEAVNIFKIQFENAQGCINSMIGCFKKMDDDRETQAKLANALRALCEKTVQALPSAETED